VAWLNEFVPPPLAEVGAHPRIAQLTEEGLLRALRKVIVSSATEIDEALLAVAKRVTFAELLVLYQIRVSKWIRFCNPDVTDADVDDVWQHVCAVVDRRAGFYRWQSESEFIALLKTIARRKVWDQIRRLSERRRIDVHQPSDSTAFNQGNVELEHFHDDTPSHLLRRKERETIVMQIMTEILTADELTAIRLKYLQAHSIEEIAEAMTRSQSAVKMLLKRARDKIRNRLGSSFNDSSH
jgi:RNA polymerase sigma factor (sigma-70 family)